MELFSVTVFALGAAAAVFAGISKGGFGSSAAFASATILALVLPPLQALGLMLPLLMLVDVASLKPYWRRWTWPEARLLMLGGIPGTLLGAAFIAWASDDVIRFLIGTVALSFVAWQLAQSRRAVRPRRVFGPGVGLASGVAAGFTSFVSHAGGPIAAVYLLGRGLNKTAYQATTVIVFWALNLLKSGFYAAMGVFSADLMLLALMLAPFALLGTWMGVRLHHLVPERLFFAVTYLLLTITGTKFVWDALS